MKFRIFHKGGSLLGAPTLIGRHCVRIINQAGVRSGLKSLPMSSTTQHLKQKAKIAFLNFLNEKYPEAKRCFNRNVDKTRKLSEDFVEEVICNRLQLSDTKQKEYDQSLKRSFKGLNFAYDARYLDDLFNQYEEDINNFPEIRNMKLWSILSLDVKSLGNKNSTSEEISEILLTKKSQYECLQLFYSMEVRKIINFLEEISGTGGEEPRELLQEHELQQTLVPERHREQEFLQLLEESLNYFGPGKRGLKTEHELQKDKASLMGRLRSLCSRAILEVDNNVFLFDKEKALEYLNLYKCELERQKRQFEKYEFDLLNFQDPDFSEPGQGLQLTDRKDISEALKEANAKRLKCIGRLQQRLEERLQDYQELKEESRSRIRGEASVNQLVAILYTLGFFSLPLVKELTQVKQASLLRLLTGHDKQNLRKAIGVVSSRPNKSLLKWAQETLMNLFSLKGAE